MSDNLTARRDILKALAAATLAESAFSQPTSPGGMIYGISAKPATRCPPLAWAVIISARWPRRPSRSRSSGPPSTGESRSWITAGTITMATAKSGWERACGTDIGNSLPDDQV